MNWKKTLVGACLAGTVAGVVFSNWPIISAQADYLLSRVDGRHSTMIRNQRWVSEVGDIIVKLTTEKAEEEGIHGIDRLSFGVIIDYIKEEKYRSSISYFYSCDKIAQVITNGNKRGNSKYYYVYVSGAVRDEDNSFRLIEDGFFKPRVFIAPDSAGGYLAVSALCSTHDIKIRR